jgi:quinol-cytochrome oxidoreductase complex cytochrome b subunit
VPWLDSSKVRSNSFRPLMRQLFWIFAADCVLLGYLGAQSADAAWNLGGVQFPLVWLARLGTLFYFGFFWVLMPIVGRIETTKPLPDSIAKSVLGSAAPAPAE